MKPIPKILVTCFAATLLTFGPTVTHATNEKVITAQQETAADLELRTKIYKIVREKTKEGFEELRKHMYEFGKKERYDSSIFEEENYYSNGGFGFEIETPEYNMVLHTRKFKDGHKTLTVQAEDKKTKEVITMTDIDVDGDIDATKKPVTEKEKKFDYFLKLAEREIEKGNYRIFAGRNDVDYYLFE